ncbi:MAG: L-amino acid N-acyltransferase YncA [Verrucomicrobiales bacterium]|jgi:L-amino acid N-acyltransferase YncA
MLRTGIVISIRQAQPLDAEEIWALFREVIKEGESYYLDDSATEEEGRDFWMGEDKTTYVAVDAEDRVVGAYVIRQNEIGRGSHLANVSYMVAPEVRGEGIGRALCADSIAETQRQGYRGIIFDCVVATNLRAVEAWRMMGFEIVGMVPNAFLHKSKGYVNIYIMYKALGEAADDSESGSP